MHFTGTSSNFYEIFMGLCSPQCVGLPLLIIIHTRLNFHFTVANFHFILLSCKNWYFLPLFHLITQQAKKKNGRMSQLRWKGKDELMKWKNFFLFSFQRASLVLQSSGFVNIADSQDQVGIGSSGTVIFPYVCWWSKGHGKITFLNFFDCYCKCEKRGVVGKGL